MCEGEAARSSSIFHCKAGVLGHLYETAINELIKPSSRGTFTGTDMFGRFTNAEWDVAVVQAVVTFGKCQPDTACIGGKAEPSLRIHDVVPQDKKPAFRFVLISFCRSSHG